MAADVQWLRPGTGEKFDETIASGDAREGGGEDGEAKPSTYVYCRAIFLRAVSLVFFAAFASLFVQVQGLLGSDGLSPAWEVVDDALKGKPSPATFLALLAGSHMPLVDAWLDIMCLVGMAVAGLGVAGYATMPSMLACWGLYLSLASVGGHWLEGKWDTLLLETGFVASLWAPLWLSRNASRPPSYVALLLIRFVLFKMLIMQALSKLENEKNGGDWRGLTALETRYATDNIPTPSVYYYHYLPSALFQLTAAYILAVELVGSFFVLSPIHLARHWTGGCVAVLPILDMAAGNYGFYPLLVLCLTIPLFEDGFWIWVLRVDEADKVQLPLTDTSEHDKESTPLLNLPIASAYGSGSAGIALGDSSDEENPDTPSAPKDEILEHVKVYQNTTSEYSSVLDQANSDHRLRVACCQWRSASPGR